MLTGLFLTIPNLTVCPPDVGEAITSFTIIIYRVPVAGNTYLDTVRLRMRSHFYYYYTVAIFLLLKGTGPAFLIHHTLPRIDEYVVAIASRILLGCRPLDIRKIVTTKA